MDPDTSGAGHGRSADAMGRKLAMSSESVLSIGDGSGVGLAMGAALRNAIRFSIEVLCIEFGMNALDLLVPHKRTLAIF